VHEAVDEQQRIAALHGHPHCAGKIVHPVAARVVALERVPEVGLVAAGDDHGRPVVGADVGEGHDHVDLTATEDAVGVAVGAPDGALVAAGVDRVVAAGRPDRGDGLIDEQPFDVAALLAAVAPHVVDPGGVVDQALEGLARLDAVVQLEPEHVVEVLEALRVAPPLARLEIGEAVERIVQVAYELGLDRTLEHEIAAQVEQVVVQVGRAHGADRRALTVWASCPTTSP
jgi:hypothetical protein